MQTTVEITEQAAIQVCKHIDNLHVSIVKCNATKKYGVMLFSKPLAESECFIFVEPALEKPKARKLAIEILEKAYEKTAAALNGEAAIADRLNPQRIPFRFFKKARRFEAIKKAVEKGLACSHTVHTNKL